MSEGERHPIDHPYVLPLNRFEEAVVRSAENKVRLDDAERRLDAINGALERTAAELVAIRTQIAKITVLGPIVVLGANLLVALLVFLLTMEGGRT